MARRAPALWSHVGDSELSCGHSDSLLGALGRAGSLRDPSRREEQLRDALAADPWLDRWCPAAAELLHTVEGLPPGGGITRLIEGCPLEGVDASMPVYRDLSPMTFAAIEVLRLRWAAVGATSSDHDILLDTLMLSSALESERGKLD